MKNIENNKRIAKNTLMLYVRMFFTMAIGLYTSRIILATLGELNFGIYNVVGGIVAMFGLLNKTLATSTQRFLNFAKGKNLLNETKKTFSISLIIHFFLAILILLISETIGLWFLNHKVNIPENRMFAAHWVFQFSILASIISILQVPYNACIIANERMKIYAYVSIVEAVLKLTIAFLILFSEYDQLITYGILILVSQLIIWCIYIIICKRNFAECRLIFIWDKPLFKNMLSYSGWNTFSGLAGVLSTEGINILLNIFFGPAINAARAIAIQVSNSVKSFVGNFQIAVNPQIVKLYATNQRQELFSLIINNAKYALFLMSMISVPFILEIDFILQLWLKNVPNYSGIFCQIILLQSLFSAIHAPLAMGIHACGKMKIPNLTTSLVYLTILPVSYLLLKLNSPSYVPFIVVLFTDPITLIIDLFILKKFISFPINQYLKTIVKAITILLIAITIPLWLHFFMAFGFLRFVVVSITILFCIVVMVYNYGLSLEIKEILLTKLKTIFKFK